MVRRPRAAPERGQALIELVIVLPFFFLIIAGVIFFGRALYAQIALDMATYDGCRAAVESLDAGSAAYQGDFAARNTLEGFYLNADNVNFQIAAGGWERGALVRCQATFDLYVGNVPWLVFHSGSSLALRSTTLSRVEMWRSDWQ